MTMTAALAAGEPKLHAPFRFVVSITLSGNYVTGGDTVDLTAAKLPVSKPPETWTLEHDSTYQFVWVPGTTLANGKIKIYDMTTVGERAAGAYPGSLTGSPIRAVFTFAPLT